jgi:hypothetical protein
VWPPRRSPSSARSIVIGDFVAYADGDAGPWDVVLRQRIRQARLDPAQTSARSVMTRGSRPAQLIAEGRLDLDTPVADVLPDFQVPTRAAARTLVGGSGWLLACPA